MWCDVGNADHPLHAKDAQERREDLEAWLLDCAAVQDVFQRARIPYQRIEVKGDGVEVTVEPQKDVLGRIKRLYDAMTDGQRFSVNYSVRVSEGRCLYTLVRRK